MSRTAPSRDRGVRVADDPPPSSGWEDVGEAKSAAQDPETRKRRRVGVMITAGMANLVVVALLAVVIPNMVESRRKAQCHQNLKRLGFAFQYYATAHEDRFPGPAIYDKKGRPLLSWRVALLLDMGLRSLYDEFHLDEPWDSPHNKALLAKMPDVFACPSRSSTGEGLTYYQVVVGPQTMFDEPEGATLASVVDGTSNTVLIAEAQRPVPWTKPEDLTYEPENVMTKRSQPLPAVGSAHRGGYHIIFVDDSVRFIKTTVAETVLRSIMTRDGGEATSADG